MRLLSICLLAAQLGFVAWAGGSVSRPAPPYGSTASWRGPFTRIFKAPGFKEKLRALLPAYPELDFLPLAPESDVWGPAAVQLALNWTPATLEASPEAESAFLSALREGMDDLLGKAMPLAERLNSDETPLDELPGLALSLRGYQAYALLLQREDRTILLESLEKARRRYLRATGTDLLNRSHAVARELGGRGEEDAVRAPPFSRRAPGLRRAPPSGKLTQTALEYFGGQSVPEPIRRSVLKLARLLDSAPGVDVQTGLLSGAYYDGLNSLRGLDPNRKALLESMLAVLEEIQPSHLAQRRAETRINMVVNTLASVVLKAHRTGLPPDEPPSAPSYENSAQAFVLAVRRWRRDHGRAFDAALASWKTWLKDPDRWSAEQGRGSVHPLTRRNLGEIRRLLSALSDRKAVVDVLLESPPERGRPSEKNVRALFHAFDELRDAVNQSARILGDSLHPNPRLRGLIANQDQNSGRHPDLHPLFPVINAVAGEDFRVLSEHFYGS